MYTPETSRHFDKYTDPRSGVVSYILKNETAPLQKMVYYVSKNWTVCGRWFWFGVAFPPGGWMEGAAITSAVLDFETDEIYLHPEAPMQSSCCDPKTGELYFCTPNKILRVGPMPDSPVEVIGDVPQKYRTFPGNMATHLTFSADGRELCCDIHSGNEMYLTSLNIETGEFTEWHHRHGGWNHAQFNPVDNDLIMFAMEFWQDMKTGEQMDIGYNEDGRRTRTWTIRRGDADAVCHLPRLRQQTHEWWSANGKYIYYTDPYHGIGRINRFTEEHVMFFTPGSWHGYSSQDDRYLCADRKYLEGNVNFRGMPSGTLFYNTLTERSVPMISVNPALYKPAEPCVYHIDPHPRFVYGDRYIAQVTTVTGKPTVAFTPVAQLIELTA